MHEQHRRLLRMLERRALQRRVECRLIGFELGLGADAVCVVACRAAAAAGAQRSEEHTSELQSLMRISYAVFCLKKTTKPTHYTLPRVVHRRTQKHNQRTPTSGTEDHLSSTARQT